MTDTYAHCCQPLMSAEDVAEYLDLPLATLYAWRSRGEGPRCMRVGRWLRYRRVDVDAWLDQKAS